MVGFPLQGPPGPSEEGLQTNKSPCEPSNHEDGIRALPSLPFLSPFVQSSGKRRPEVSHVPGPGVCALAWKAQERSHGGGISGIGFSCCIGINLPEIQPHGGPASSGSKGGVYTEPVTAPSSMPTAGTHVSCLQMFTTPPSSSLWCLGTNRRVEGQSDWQWMAQGLPQSATALGFRSQTRD